MGNDWGGDGQPGRGCRRVLAIILMIIVGILVWIL
jgi:hypothetical protein